MAANSSTLLILRFLRHKGRQQLGPQWPLFRQSLLEALQQRGILEKETDELLLLLYPHPHVALGSVYEAMEQARKKAGSVSGALPVQIILDLDREGNDRLAVQDPAAAIWEGLQPEAVNVTRSLKLQWESLMTHKELPTHSFVNSEQGGLFELKLTDRAAIKTKGLFPHRELPILGRNKECFYCGSRGHKPAACPSKLLTMESRGLQEAGYQTLPNLAACYQQVFTNQKAVIELIAAGITAPQIRDNPKLQAFLAFFDISSLYQLRFLRYLAFTSSIGWKALKQSTEIDEIDSRNLDMGLDCLRVGQYDKAEEYLEEGRMRREGKLFYARVAQAFRALELDREKDMGTLLESALSLAELEKERVYINLLLIRYYAWQGDLWKAEQTSDQIATLFGDQPEVEYARIQILARQNFVDRAHRQLRKIISRQRFYFLAALLDPVFLPIHQLVDDMLTARLDQLLLDAGSNMNEAVNNCEELKTWFEADDPELKGNLAVMSRIEKQYQKKTCFDLLDVIRGSKSLTLNCQRLLNEKTDLLLSEVNELAAKRHNTYLFWQKYPFKSLFTRILNDLLLIHRKLEKCRLLLQKNDGPSYRQALALHQEAGKILEGTQPLLTRMIWVKEILSGLLIFGRKLLLTEFAVATLALVVLFGMPFLLSGSDQDSSLSRLLGDPLFVKQGLIISLVFIAPALALALTFRDNRKE